MFENLTTDKNTLESAKYKAISLLGRPAVNKLLENGLVIMTTTDLSKLHTDLYALIAQLQLLTQENQENQELIVEELSLSECDLPIITKLPKQEAKKELMSESLLLATAC